MQRKVRLLFASLCFLLIFSPITQQWVQAEETGTPVDDTVEFEGTVLGPVETSPENADAQVDNSTIQATSDSEQVTEETATQTQTDCPAEENVDSSQVDSTVCPPEEMAEESSDTVQSTADTITSEPIPFVDVPTTYWAYQNIQHLSSLKVINGYDNGDGTFSFHPDDKVTRAQAAKMIIEAIGEKEAPVTTQIFTDVPVNNWAAGYIQRAYELGIFKGYNDGRFGAADTLKRSQMAKVIVEAYHFDYNGYTPTTSVFFDIRPTYWAYDYIQRLHYNGISNGSNYQFMPEDLISRAQFSAFLSRASDTGFRLKVTGPVLTQGKVTSKTPLNIRESASGTATILGSLPTGTMVNIMEMDGFWAMVNYNGITGYVYKSYLKLYSPDPSTPLLGRIIVVDAGHGYQDPGTNHNGIYEKNIVLSVAKKVAEKLRAAGANVVMTRDTDSFLSLQERVDVAEESYAEIFVSIHVNSVESAPTAKGTETYYNTSNNENGAESQSLAYEIQKQIVSEVDMNDRGTKDSGFYVIKYNQIPAVLVELGFLSNTDDRNKLTSEVFQSMYADAIYKGIENYYSK
ncbi:N-acetylmuramoyl-L-alanine amidase [Neobacillus sp. D3-1R]|uniref:N-acetylmuramoyl-L-alanine amidase n=1 Tax=Neobacillus sp. D3-1R TaxID=3445778 RepID=UPI003FA05555